MALLGSNKNISKKDINFFGEFTASARKQTQVLAVVVFVGIVAIGLCLAIVVYDIFRNTGVQRDVDSLNATLASDEYAGLELKSQSLQEEINDKNQYYYTLTEMRRIVDETTSVSMEVIDTLGESIPSDAYVSTYMVTGNNLTVTGETFSHYDAANICYLLNQSDIFASEVAPAIERNEGDFIGEVENPEENPIDVYYDFSVSGNLISDSIISVGHYQNTETGVIALSGVSTQKVAIGDNYEFTGIASYTANGNTYTLVSININDVTLSEAEFAEVMSEDKLTGMATGNVEISLYYTLGEATEEGSAE